MSVSKEELIGAFSESLGTEAAENIVRQKLVSSGLKWKDSYSSQEIVKLSIIMAQAGGLVGAIAQRFVLTILKKEKEFAEFLFDTSPSATFTVDMNRVVMSWNKKAEEISGFSAQEIIGNSCSMMSKECREENCMFNIGKEENARKIVLTTANGEERTISKNSHFLKDGHNKVIGAIESFEDITERLKSEEERKMFQEKLFMTDKVIAIGQLAGGIAHELNNPMGIICGFAQCITKRVKDGDPLYLPAQSIEREVMRCKVLIEDLLTFSRKENKDYEITDINLLVEQTLSLVKPQARIKNVEIIKKYKDGLPEIYANKNMIQRIIVNLCNNAIDAISDKGTITITTKQLENGIQLIIADSGQGMSENVKIHIFEPFYTTKDVGKGTGLGLSLCYEIIKRHNGTIHFESKLGEGTTFYITLPLNKSQSWIRESK